MTEDESREALEAALRQHVATSANGAYLTDWLVIAAAAMPDDPDVTTYVSEASEGPMHHRLGLVRYIAKRADGDVACDCED